MVIERFTVHAHRPYTGTSSCSPSLYGYFFSRQVLRPRRMGFVGALSEVCNLGCLEISAEYDLLLVIFGCIFLLKYSTIRLRYVVRKLISSALEKCTISFKLYSDVHFYGNVYIPQLDLDFQLENWFPPPWNNVFGPNWLRFVGYCHHKYKRQVGLIEKY